MSRFSSVPRQKLIKFLLKNGFAEERRKNSKHMVFGKEGIGNDEGIPCSIVISRGSKYKDLHVSTVKSVLKAAGLSLKDLNRFLGRE